MVNKLIECIYFHLTLVPVSSLADYAVVIKLICQRLRRVLICVIDKLNDSNKLDNWKFLHGKKIIAE